MFCPLTKFLFNASLLVAVVSLSFSCPVDAGAQTVIFQNNFDSRSAGPYTDAELDEDFDEPDFNNGVTEGRVSVVSGQEAFGGSGSALAVVYPAGVHGTRETGAQWRLSFDQSYEEATLSYRVRFGPGFDFVRGGKLPGLAGGTAPTGSTQATGFNGWTGRIMWRTDFNGVSGQPQQLTSGGITYAKYTDSGFAMDGDQEDRNFFFNPDESRTTFVSDQWYEITQRIRMNTPGEFNGIQQIWIDGVLVIDEQNLRYRLTDDFSIDQMYFSTFYGGNEDWRTSKAEVAFFDDFVISVPGESTPDDDDDDDGGDDDGGDSTEDGLLLVPAEFPTVALALAAASAGDTIQITGEIVENVVVSKSVCIEGGDAGRIVGANDNLDVIDVRADNVILKDLEILGGRQGVLVRPGIEDVEIASVLVRYSGNIGIAALAGCHGFTVTDTLIRDCGSDGVRVISSDNIMLIDNYSQRNGGHGFRLTPCNSAMISFNRTFLNDFHGFLLEGTGLSLVENLSVSNGFHGFSVEGEDYFMFDNLAKENEAHGFRFVGVADSQLIDNRSRFNGGNGYRLQSGSSGNLLDDNNSTGNNNRGILLLQSSNNSIINSFVFENTSDGIFLNSTSNGNLVEDNVIRCNDGEGIRDFGDNDSDDNIVRDNGQ